MGALFSRNKSPPQKRVTSHDKAVLDLKSQRDRLKQYQKKCVEVSNRETEIARQLLSQGKKKEALLALKKKKYQTQLLNQTEAQLSNISQMIDSIEFTQLEVKVFEGLKEGNQVLKELQNQMKVEDVEALMDDIADTNETQRQIEEALSGKLSSVDEDAVLAELEELEALEEGIEFPTVPIQDPTVPDRVPVSEAKSERREAVAV
eukprot:TRINITY_DN1793_c0_g1_i1.p1 TRINITY_DN1793_c0_g1~~TRINITY_DN1793_c0_g1_i1.p1  ORF type:complete len:205 (-),score=87.29 TRINITY_DN1793_c0_g1_i1:855-1469(-)